MKFIALIFLGLLIQFKAFAGPGSSGGGAGIFCPPSVTDQPSVQLLDLYEGKILSKYTYSESSVPYKKQLNDIAELLNFDFSVYLDFKKGLAELEAKTEFLPKGVSIAMPIDLGTEEAVIIPTGCNLNGVGYYQQDKLIISTDAFSQLTETQKAAFFAHEAFYKMNRFFTEIYLQKKSSSISTRKLVAQLFSDQQSQIETKRLSRPMTWEILGEKETQWTVAANKRKFVAYEAQYSPILLKDKVNKASIELNVVKPDNDFNAQVFCQMVKDSRYGHVELNPLERRFVDGNGKTWVQLDFDIPKDCSVLYFQSMQRDHSGNTYRTQYRLSIEGEVFIRGANAQAYGLYLPIYYN